MNRTISFGESRVPTNLVAQRSRTMVPNQSQVCTTIKSGEAQSPVMLAHDHAGVCTGKLQLPIGSFANPPRSTSTQTAAGRPQCRSDVLPATSRDLTTSGQDDFVGFGPVRLLIRPSRRAMCRGIPLVDAYIEPYGLRATMLKTRSPPSSEAS